MDPKLWGPSLWKIIHSIKIKKIKNKNELIFLMYSIGKIIPCKKCSKHMIQFIQFGHKKIKSLYKINFTQTDYLEWTYKFHDVVNKFINKTSPDFKLIKKFYNNYNMNIDDIFIFLYYCTKNNNNNYYYIVLNIFNNYLNI